jgi:cell division protein FtsB
MNNFKNSQQINRQLTNNVEKLATQNSNLIKHINSLNANIKDLSEELNSLNAKNSDLSKELNSLNAKNNDLSKELNSLNANNKDLSKELLETFILYVSNNSFYIDIQLSKIITIDVPRGNTICKYLNLPNINIIDITLDNIQLNNNKQNFLGFMINDCLYLTIPNILNSNKLNLLKIGDEIIQIYHNFTPKIELVQVIKITNTNIIYINIYGENLFLFSKVYISYLENNYNVFIKKFTTNNDYTCIRCSYHMDVSLNPTLNHKVYIVNYDLSSISYSYEVKNSINMFSYDVGDII